MFTSARLKLTFWYLLIAMFISGAFSLAIYKASANELERFETAQKFRIERRLQNGFPLPSDFHSRLIGDVELMENTKKRLLLTLLFMNGGILILAGTAGYFLAGRTLKPIKEMVDEQNRFISDASHELRTPLTALKTSMEVYLRDKDPSLEEARTLIMESVTDVNKLQLLSDSLLQLAQYHKQPNKSHFEKLSLLPIVNESIRKVSSLAKKKKINIVSKVKDVQFQGSKDGMVNVLVILLDNAIKYSPQKKTIIVSSEKKNNNICILVTDNGIGIDQQDIPHIFDRFFRADSARLPGKNGGYGLGLSIANKIIETHQGSISVKSTLGKGTVFTIKLPQNT